MKPKRKLSDENLLSPKKEVGGENNRSLESGTRWKVTLAVMILLIFAASLIAFASMSNGEIITAKAEVLKAVKGGQPSGSMGIIEFSQDTSTNKVKITGELTGLTAGEHGFHIHAKGDLGNGCVDAGGHYNPENKTHGAPMDNVRHVGDLGNIKAGAEKATITIEDGVIQLKGPHSIIGRALVVHSGVDDLGKGGDAESLKTGNAGSRVGCGVVMKSAFTAKPLSSLLILSLALISFRILF